VNDATQQIDIRAVLARLVVGERLAESESSCLFETLLSGGLDDAQIGAILAIIQGRGATVDELVGAARAMRRHVTPVPYKAEPGEVVIDTCGTGGATKTFNISTASALVLAAVNPDAAQGSGWSISRVVVAKHGNRSRTGRGSAEVLAGLGVNIEASPEVQAKCLREIGVCFSFAMLHHPAMRHAAGPRRSLGFPTIFNLLGPLTNPAGAKRQLLGVYDAVFVEPMAEVLARLGSISAVVIHGSGGLDEVSSLGPSRAVWVRDGKFERADIDPKSVIDGAPPIEALRAQDLDHGVRIIRDVLAGSAGPQRDIVVLNVAAALMVAGVAADIERGAQAAIDAIDSGRAERVLLDLIELSGP